MLVNVERLSVFIFKIGGLEWRENQAEKVLLADFRHWIDAFGLLSILGIFLILILNHKVGKFLNLMIDWTKDLVSIGRLSCIDEAGLNDFELFFKLLLELTGWQVKRIFLHDPKTYFPVDEFIKGVIFNLWMILNFDFVDFDLDEVNIVSDEIWLLW